MGEPLELEKQAIRNQEAGGVVVADGADKLVKQAFCRRCRRWFSTARQDDYRRCPLCGLVFNPTKDEANIRTDNEWK